MLSDVYNILGILVVIFVLLYSIKRAKSSITTKSYTKVLTKQGATTLKFEHNPHDDFFTVKQAIQKDPEMKAILLTFTGKVALFFTNSSFIKQVLTNDLENYKLLESDVELYKLLYKQGLPLLEGEAWRLHHKVLTMAFQPNLLEAMIPSIIEATSDFLKTGETGKVFIKLPISMQFLTGEMILRGFFGAKSSDLLVNKKPINEQIDSVLKDLTTYNYSVTKFFLGMWALNIFGHYRRLKSRIAGVRRTLRQKIQQRAEDLKRSPESERKKDVLAFLFQHQLDNNSSKNDTLSNEEILDEFLSLFASGKDNASLLITMALYCLAKNSVWASKLRGEIKEKFKDPSQITLETLNSMDLMTAFLNEVLRMYPPGAVMMPRVSKADHLVGNMMIKKGCIVNTFFIANHYNPKYFKSPENFDPNRWLRRGGSEDIKGDPFVFLPFSGGARVSIEKNLALMQAKIVLSLIIKQFDIEIDPAYQLAMGRFGTAYGPTNEMSIILAPR